ncbi:MAG: DUF2202 domain-containing protein [Actinomycetota bacterium]|nr:DUF2202 domain-containing protein [Actinomycetota bacterium]
MQQNSRTAARVGMAVLVALAVVSCSSNGTGNGGGNGGNGNGNGNGGGNGSGVGPGGETSLNSETLAAQMAAMPLAELTDAQRDGLLQMREEEKLAHDVYVALGAEYEVNVFVNIPASEQTHADAMLLLLERYGLADPAAGNAPGEFTDPAIAALYTALVEQGRESLTAALTVGATVEDLDLADLASLATAAPDITLVYDHLARGSRNHLRAFTRQLGKQGADYTPQYITQAEYDAIVAGEMEQGNGG